MNIIHSPSNNDRFFFLLQSLTFQKINRAITAIDAQPTFDGGVLINVLGRLQVSRQCNFQISYKYPLQIFFQ